MTPIDDELRTALHRRAEAVTPPADPLAGIERRAGRIRRRRIAAAVVGTTLAVAVLTVAVPVGLAQLRDGPTPEAGFAVRGRPSAATPSRTGDSPPPTVLSWPVRSSLSESSDFADEIRRLWSAAHHSDGTGRSLLQVGLPEGGVAGIFQLWANGSQSAYTVVGQRLPNGQTFIIQDTVTPQGVKEVSSVLQGGAFPHVAVVGPPETEQIRYAADGNRFLPVERLEGYFGGDGWAVFDRTGPAIDQRLPDRIELLDGTGESLYRGTIDVGPSLPDK